MFIWICLLTFNVRPLTLKTGKAVIQTWGLQAFANDDIERSNHLKTVEKHYNIAPTPNLGCVCVTNNDHITSIALIEKITNNTISVWNIETNDMISGTLLVRGFIHSNNVTLMFDVDPRWHIAASYFRESHLRS